MFNLSRKYKKSYSQQGEDLVIDFILKSHGIETPFYFDIGSNHPILLSNTFYFYKKGGKGVCIDPNISFTKGYKSHRPKDTFLPYGVTYGESCIMDYYVMDWNEFNTFDKEQAKNVETSYNGRNNIKNVVALPVKNINDVLNKYVDNPIDFLNLDVEGFDLELLKVWDFRKFSPKVICVELKDLKNNKVNHEIQEFLESESYVLEAKNLINGIFVK